MSKCLHTRIGVCSNAYNSMEKSQMCNYKEPNTMLILKNSLFMASWGGNTHTHQETDQEFLGDKDRATKRDKGGFREYFGSFALL